MGKMSDNKTIMQETVKTKLYKYNIKNGCPFYLNTHPLPTATMLLIMYVSI